MPLPWARSSSTASAVTSRCPGIDNAVWTRIFESQAGGLPGLFDAPSGGSIGRLAIFALGILPYVTAALLLQLAAIGLSSVRTLSERGYLGLKTLRAYTRYLTLALAASQGYGIAQGLESIRGVVATPGPLFTLSTVLTLTAGTMLVVWIADQITERGIGNGIALILAVGFAVELPSTIASAFVGVNHGSVSPNIIAVSAVLAAAIIALIVLVEGARRQISVDYAKREIGGRSIEAVSAPLALKVNNAGGIMPAFLANWIILLPAAVAIYAFGADSALGSFILNHLQHGRPVFMILFWLMIVAFTLFYTAFLLDPEKVSQTLKAHGGTFRGIEPGESTAAYFDDVVSRITTFAGFYLAFVFIIPELLAVYFHVPFYLGGQAFLIVVCAVLDIGAYKQQIQLQPGGARP